MDVTGTPSSLSRSDRSKYIRIKSLAEEEAKLKARARELAEERRKLAGQLAKSFGNRDRLRIRRGLVLVRKVVEVPAAVIERAAYSYLRWEEVSECELG